MKNRLCLSEDIGTCSTQWLLWNEVERGFFGHIHIKVLLKWKQFSIKKLNSQLEFAVLAFTAVHVPYRKILTEIAYLPKKFQKWPIEFSLCRRINVPKNSKNNLGYRGWNGGVSVFIFNIVIHVILLYCKRKHFAQRSMLEYNDFGRSWADSCKSSPQPFYLMRTTKFNLP